MYNDEHHGIKVLPKNLVNLLHTRGVFSSYATHSKHFFKVKKPLSLVVQSIFLLILRILLEPMSRAMEQGSLHITFKVNVLLKQSAQQSHTLFAACLNTLRAEV